MSFKEALSIKGKLAFAENQVFCKLGATLSRLLSRWARDGRDSSLGVEIRSTLAWTVEHLRSAGPRIIAPPCDSPPVLVFTDGACEETVSVGGVIILPCGRTECFGAVLDQDSVDAFKVRDDQLHVIGQAEILPVTIAKLTWASLLSGKKSIFFIDNEAARIGLIRGYSPVLPSLRLILESAMWDYANDCKSWSAPPPWSVSRVEVSVVPTRWIIHAWPGGLMRG